EQGRALRLLIAQLGELPDFQRGAVEGGLVPVDGRGDLLLRLGRQLPGQGGGGEADEGGGEGEGSHRNGLHGELRKQKKQRGGRRLRLPPLNDERLIRRSCGCWRTSNDRRADRRCRHSRRWTEEADRKSTRL